MFESWYIHIEGETYGPLSTDAVSVMLKQNRIHFSDFIWKKNFSKWVRIIDVKIFAAQLNPYPRAPLPTTDVPYSLLKIPQSNPRDHESLKGELESKKVSRLRLAPRVIIDGKLVVKNIGTYRVLDISEGGVYVSSSDPLEIGHPVEFTLQTDSLGEHSGSGVVVRHNSDNETPGFAVNFLEIDRNFVSRIQAYILSEQSPRKRAESA